MTSETQHFMPMLKKKQSSSRTYVQKNSSKRSHLLLKKNSFFGCSSSEENGSQESNYSNKNDSTGQRKAIWTRKQDLSLISLFKENGANWTEISNRLQNKTPQEVKYHFHRLIRNIIQNINITLRQKGDKQIDLKSMKAAIELSSCCENETSIKANYSSVIRDQVSRLIYNSLTNNQELYNICEEKSLQTIHQILQTIKRDRKKKHSSKASTEIYMKQEIQFDQFQRGYQSDSSSVFEQPRESLNEHIFTRNNQNLFADEEALSENRYEQANGIVVEESQQGIKDLLRLSGLLEVQQCNTEEKDMAYNYQDAVLSGSQNLNNQSYQHFFEQNQLDCDCYWKKNSHEVNQVN